MKEISIALDLTLPSRAMEVRKRSEALDLLGIAIGFLSAGSQNWAFPH